MYTDPIVDEIYRVREQMLDEFGGDVDALIEDVERRAVNGEFGEFRIVSRLGDPGNNSGHTTSDAMNDD
jgi:hypothetical protein